MGIINQKKDNTMSLPTITIIGNLTADPELRITNGGNAMCNFTVAASERKKDGDQWVDGDTTFIRCTAWRNVAENVAESLTKGSSVVVVGRLRQNTVEKDGSKQTYFNLDVDTIGVNLSRGPVHQERAQKQQSRSDDPWGASDPNSVPF